MKRLTDAKLKAVEQLITVAKAERTYKTIFGIVHPKDGLLYSLEHSGSEWVKCEHIPDVYIPAKMERALTSDRRFIVIIGGRGCLHPDSLINTPSGDVKISDFSGGYVYSHNGKEVVVAYAGKPIEFDYQDMFEVLTSDGKKITCTDEHLFYNGRDWVMTKDLRVGEHVLTSELRTAFSSPLHSSLGSGLLELLEDVQNLNRTLLNCLASYLLCLRQCDLQPQLAKEIFLESAPLQACEQQHSFHALFRLDDQEFSCKDNPSSALFRLSSLSALPELAEKNSAYLESYNAYKSFELLSQFYLQFQQSQQCINLTRLALEFLELSPVPLSAKHQVEKMKKVLCKLERVFGDNPFEYPSVETSTTLSCVESIRKVDRLKYYDLHVAGTNCYFADGFLNHNSGKSNNQASIDAVLVKDLGYKIYELREFQNSLEDSVHSLLQSEIERLSLGGFTSQNNIIFHESGGEFKFKGLARNPASIKSAANFNRFVVEEAATLSEESIKHLTPTARNKAKAGLPSKFAAEQAEEFEEDSLRNVQIVFLANPASSADPFSQRFIVPFQEYLERDGFYEDELHTIIQMNYYDNPWFEDSGLEAERRYDEENLPYASYKHIWLGGFNDHVENALIPAEWFNAAIDAHKKLNFVARGAIVASHDPSDQGDDPKGYALRQGSVVREVKEILHRDAYQGCGDALGFCHADNADYFIWDGDGLGATLRNHITNLSAGKKTVLQMFRGSESPDNPDAVYSFDGKGVAIRNPKTNKDTFKNKRAQYYWAMRDRFYATYRAVVHGEYIDPDLMISLCSDGIENMDKLRSEVCRVPLKNNNQGYIQIMSKIEMKAIKIPSPNMADALMMSFANQAVIVQNVRTNIVMPRPLQAMGRR